MGGQQGMIALSKKAKTKGGGRGRGMLRKWAGADVILPWWR